MIMIIFEHLWARRGGKMKMLSGFLNNLKQKWFECFCNACISFVINDTSFSNRLGSRSFFLCLGPCLALSGTGLWGRSPEDCSTRVSPRNGVASKSLWAYLQVFASSSRTRSPQASNLPSYQERTCTATLDSSVASSRPRPDELTPCHDTESFPRSPWGRRLQTSEGCCNTWRQFYKLLQWFPNLDDVMVVLFGKKCRIRLPLAVMPAQTISCCGLLYGVLVYLGS